MKQLYLDEFSKSEIAPIISISIVDKHEQTFFETDSERCYDIASLTKVVNAYYLVKLFNKKNILLSSKVYEFISCELNITIQELLTHTSGLKDVKLNDYSLESVLLNIKSSDNKSINYADINYILIYYVLESLVGDVSFYIETELKKSGIVDMFYAKSKTRENRKFVISERKTDRDCLGCVHDTKAFLMDGVSSHAGLFATSRALINFGELVLGDKEFMDSCFESSNLVESESEKRTLGFEICDKFHQYPCNNMQLFHTGFTGCSLLIDYKNQLVVVLLTNYLMNGRDVEKIHTFRNKVHSQIYKDLQYE